MNGFLAQTTMIVQSFKNGSFEPSFVRMRQTNCRWNCLVSHQEFYWNVTFYNSLDCLTISASGRENLARLLWVKALLPAGG